MSRAQQEFEAIDLGDPRLSRRAMRLVKRLRQKHATNIAGTCGNWAETAAAYRFLCNEQVTHKDMMAAHGKATVASIREHPVGPGKTPPSGTTKARR